MVILSILTDKAKLSRKKREKEEKTMILTTLSVYSLVITVFFICLSNSNRDFQRKNRKMSAFIKNLKLNLALKNFTIELLTEELEARNTYIEDLKSDLEAEEELLTEEKTLVAGKK